jgi:hypothetical protein
MYFKQEVAKRSVKRDRKEGAYLPALLLGKRPGLGLIAENVVEVTAAK